MDLSESNSFSGGRDHESTFLYFIYFNDHPSISHLLKVGAVIPLKVDQSNKCYINAMHFLYFIG